MDTRFETREEGREQGEKEGGAGSSMEGLKRKR